MTDLLWECVIISLVLLFGVNIGLATGLTKLSKVKTLIISILYGVILFALSMISYYTTSLYNVISSYIAYLIGIIGIITILCGIYTVINWKRDKEKRYSFKSLTIMIPSICCFIGFVFAAILFNDKNTETNFMLISILMAVIFAVVILIFNLFSQFLKYAERPYPVLLGNYMILNGFYFLIAGLFIPNFKSLALLQTNPLTISSTTNMIFLLMAAAGVFLLGVYLTKEEKTV